MNPEWLAELGPVSSIAVSIVNKLWGKDESDLRVRGLVPTWRYEGMSAVTQIRIPVAGPTWQLVRSGLLPMTRCSRLWNQIPRSGRAAATRLLVPSQDSVPYQTGNCSSSLQWSTC